MIRFAHGAASDVGRVRSLNEDSHIEEAALFAVADGMGGHRGGEVASAEALEALRISVLEPDAPALRSAVEAANRAVYSRSVAEPDLAGMGTTLCAVALVRDDEGDPSVGVVNVGDSRVYRLHQQAFEQITEDHSLVETMVRGGQLSPEEAAHHPGRNVLTRALGIEPEVDVDYFPRPVVAGDRYLLCSDGLFNELHDGQIEAVLRRLADPAEAAAELVRLATEAGGRDNVTVVVVDVLDDEGGGPAGVRAAPPEDDPLGLSVERTQPVPAVRADAPPPAASPASAPSTPTAAPEPRARLTWRVWAFAAALVAVVGVAVGAIVATGDDPAPATSTTVASSTSTSTSTEVTTTSTTSSVAPPTTPAAPTPGP